MFQSVRNLPAGYYQVKASVRNTDGVSYLSDQRVYALVRGTLFESEYLTEVGGEDNNAWFELTADNVLITEGQTLRLGIRSTGTGSGTKGWFQADHFRLYYLGANPTAIDEVSNEYESVKVLPQEGGIHVISSVECQLPVYVLNGTLFKIVDIQVGVQNIALPHGHYVVNGKVLLVK